MRKKIWIMLGIGFLIGVAMVLLVPALFNRAPDGTVHFYSEGLLERVGSPTAALLTTVVLYGLYGACCMGGTQLYAIERWPLALATVVHYLVIALGYLLASRLLCWNLSIKALLIIEGLMAVGFFIIWIIMYLRYKAEVRELNKLMEKDKDNRKDGIV